MGRKKKSEIATSKRLVGYVRVSTEEQAQSGLSLAEQQRQLRAYCDLYGFELVGVYEDAGVSAATLDREGLQSALAAMKSEAAGLIVSKLDRLTRRVFDAGELFDTVFRDRQLVSVGEQLDTSTAAGRLTCNLLVSVAQWERETIAERTRAAMRQKKAKGQSTGVAPFGYRKETDKNTEKKILVPDAVEHPILDRMKKLRGEGLGWSAIAEALNAEGLPNRSGRVGTWTPAHVYKILDKTPKNAA